ncbi:MAG: D-2-hydroxyacid dehydrogenase [Peptococcaceae bacterium]
MKFLFGFYRPIPEFAGLMQEFPQHQFVFAENLGQITEEIEDSDALFILAPNYKPDVAQVVKEKAQKLAWIQATTVGVDDIQINGFPPGVIVTKAAGIYDVNVAEQAVALLLAITRQVAASEREKKQGLYNRAARWEGTSSIERKKIVIIGYGGIGRQTAKRLKAFDTRIIVCDISQDVTDQYVDEFFKPEQLAEYLPQADIVILTLPQTKDNIYLINEKTLGLMKHEAILINVARGKLVKESALAGALKNGSIAAAGLDVFEEEPLPANSELWDLDNLVFTPHLGGKGDYNEERLADLFRENIKRFVGGEQLKNVVNWQQGF